jgi:DNA-binding response OmpR family regulator
MAPATVLLIDSDADSLAIYSLILTHHGYEVVQATDGDTGLQLAFERRPDVVVSELYMPKVDGATLLERLRGDARTAATPLIVLDSVPSFARELRGSEAKLHRLAKPCEPSRLLQEVRRLLTIELPVAL